MTGAIGCKAGYGLVGVWDGGSILFGFLRRVMGRGKGRGLGIVLGVGDGERSFAGGCGV